MLVEEMLHEKMFDIETRKELDDMLDKISNDSRTTKVWVDCLIKPVFYIMMFLRAERKVSGLFNSTLYV